jgi:hypothetical protein
MGLRAKQAKRNIFLDPGEAAEPTGDILPLATEKSIAGALRVAIPLLLVVFTLLRFWNFTYDVPPSAPLLGFPTIKTDYAWDAAVYSDEGFYAVNAISFVQSGRFHNPLEYSQFINLPLMQFIKGMIFSVFGISLFAARMVSILSAVGLVVAMYFVVRRYEDPTTSLLAAFVVSINHFIFVFSRYAIDEVPVTFLVTLTFAFAVRVRGERWWLYAFLTAVTFACALLTKSNAVFATPLIGAMVIIQEVDVKKILLKFILCSAVFFAIMVPWYVTLVIPNKDTFEYFFSINVGLTGSGEAEQMWRVFESQAGLFRLVDVIMSYSILVMTPLLFLLSPRYRRHPLIYVALLWYLLYMMTYAYYGRFYPRFFAMTVPPLALWVAITMREALELRGRLRLVTYAFVALVACSSLWQVHRVVSVLAYGKNTWNEMAAEFERIIHADPSGNRVVMGHSAITLGLRADIIPRHSHFGVASMPERLEAFKPGWFLCDGEMRSVPMHRESEFCEWFELYYDLDLVAIHDILDNFRGHGVYLYKLTPKENVEFPPPVVRSQFLVQREQAP